MSFLTFTKCVRMPLFAHFHSKFQSAGMPKFFSLQNFMLDSDFKISNTDLKKCSKTEKSNCAQFLDCTFFIGSSYISVETNLKNQHKICVWKNN